MFSRKYFKLISEALLCSWLLSELWLFLVLPRYIEKYLPRIRNNETILKFQLRKMINLNNLTTWLSMLGIYFSYDKNAWWNYTKYVKLIKI